MKSEPRLQHSNSFSNLYIYIYTHMNAGHIFTFVNNDKIKHKNIYYYYHYYYSLYTIQTKLCYILSYTCVGKCMGVDFSL